MAVKSAVSTSETLVTRGIELGTKEEKESK